MLRVYDENERVFSHNGIKALHPIFAEILKVDNGDYYLEIEDVVENLNCYQQGLIIRCDTPWGLQGFRCSNPRIQNNRVICTAWHLSYDTKNYLIDDRAVVNQSCNAAMAYFNSLTDTESPFTVSSDIGTVGSLRAVRKSLWEIFNQLISADMYGGHFERDNFNFAIKNKIGTDRGVVLANDKNITDIEVEEIWDDVCTKILPYTTDNNTAITLDETYVSVDEQYMYDIPYTKVVKFENPYKAEEFETDEAYKTAVKEWLRLSAGAYLEANKVPKVNYSVSAKIENVSDVGDIIKIKHSKCKVELLTNVISVRYDVLRKKYKKIEFGNFRKELKTFKQDIIAEVNKNTDEKIAEQTTFIQSELEEATALINSMLGDRSYIHYKADCILITDTPDEEHAINCIKINSAGIGFSKSGVYGTFNSAWTIDGKLNMQNIKVLNLTASMIKGGTLVLGGVDNSDGKLEIRDGENKILGSFDNTGVKVYAQNGWYVSLNSTEGFAIFDSNGQKRYYADSEAFRMDDANAQRLVLGDMVKIIPVENNTNKGIGFIAL